MKSRVQRIIACIFVFALLVAGSGTGLDATHSVAQLKEQDPLQAITEKSLLPGDAIATYQIVEKNAVAGNLIESKNNRSETGNRAGLVLFLLLSLAACGVQFCSECVIFREGRCLNVRRYQITYMQDMDGRKRNF